MNKLEFRRIVETFADAASDVEINREYMVAQIAGQLISCELKKIDGSLVVKEDDREMRAEQWISLRLARMPLLADRLLTYIPEVSDYVSVSGVVDEIDNTEEGLLVRTDDVESSIRNFSDKKIPGTTSILYLTSDAGEGKTTIINSAARRQAQLYKEKKSNWLLVPISLGGRPFIRFDDVVSATLANKYRFQFVYYDAVVELIRLGYIVLALDGFEEMFVQGPKGEGVSSLGGLVERLDSEGTLVIAARKAYFEFKNFKTQGKLFDTLSTRDVVFSKIAIDRWKSTQFINYGLARGKENAEDIYRAISSSLDPEHPLLKRAVLVKRLYDVADTLSNQDALVKRVRVSGDKFFKEFIDVIVEREVSEKWIDRGGEVAKPLLSKDGHYELLAYIAEEMWISSIDALPESIMDMLSDLLSEKMMFPADIARQIKERIKHHSLIVKDESLKDAFRFDHNDFQSFFLGYRLSQLLVDDNVEEFRVLARQSTFPLFLVEMCVSNIKDAKVNVRDTVDFLRKVASATSSVSVTRENCGSLIIKLLNRENGAGIMVRDLLFPTDSLAYKTIQHVNFANCFFQASGTSESAITDSFFDDCKFDRLDIAEDCTFVNTTFKNSIPNHVYVEKSDFDVFNPVDIWKILVSAGINVQDDKIEENLDGDTPLFSEDSDLLITKRALRVFLRSTFVNDGKLRVKLGKDSNHFFDSILPSLLSVGVLKEIPFEGGGKQKRYKVEIRMASFDAACASSRGKFTSFLNYFAK